MNNEFQHPDDEPDWKAVQRAIDKKRDDEFLKEAEEAKKHMPPEIQELLNLPGARVLTPSEVEGDSHLSLMDQLIRNKLELEDLRAHYKSALVMLHAAVQTYGLEVGKGHYTLYVSDEMLEASPHCITIEAKADTDIAGSPGHQIHATAHDCGVSRN